MPIAGLILGIVGKKCAGEVGAPTGMAIAGIIMSIIALAFALISTIACAACWGALAPGFNDIYPFYDPWY